MRLVVRTLILPLLPLASLSAGQAVADSGCVRESEVRIVQGVLTTTTTLECPQVVVTPADDSTSTDADLPVLAANCSVSAVDAGGNPIEQCMAKGPTDAAPATVTPGLVLRAFRRIPLPPADLVIQPPGGKTLVNFPTIFSADAQPFQRDVRLLGRTIQLKIWPSSFEWVFGDAESLTTDEAGTAYDPELPMSDYITHEYADAGVTVSPRVHTTYSAEFSLDRGRTWTPVGGTVTINGAPASLRVVEARPVLVGSD